MNPPPPLGGYRALGIKGGVRQKLPPNENLCIVQDELYGNLQISIFNNKQTIFFLAESH